MRADLRDSLKLWAAGIAFMAIFWLLLRSDLFEGLSDQVPAGWFWLVTGGLAVWSIGQFGWGLWQRRASKTR